MGWFVVGKGDVSALMPREFNDETERRTFEQSLE